MSRKIEQLIQKEIQFPSLPAIAVEILDSVNKDDAPLNQLGDLISLDPALSAKMLKIANSGIFAAAREISSLNRAMAVLGTNTIRSIALSFVISSDLCSKRAGYNIEDFWRRSAISAVAAELIGKRINHRDENLFLTGLLQDLGLLAILLSKGDEYRILLDNYKDLQQELKVLEQEKYGFDHQQVGNALLNHWNLPETITTPIRYHHCPDEAPSQYETTTRILEFANKLGELYTSNEDSQHVRVIQKDMAEQFDIAPDETLDLIDQVAEKARELITMFDLDPSDITPYTQLLQQANNQLEQLNLNNAQMILELQDAKKKVDRLVLKLQESNSRLRELVYQDALTGLYNHRYFQEALDSELARSKRYQASLSLVLFDIDNFKTVNDSYGHPAGDLVLMNVATAVKSAVRTNDTVARFGGDEFAIILPSTNSAGAKTFAEKLRLAIEGIATLIDGQSISVTISSGVITVGANQNGINKNKLIEMADTNLYQSKQQGRNRVTTTSTEN